MTNLDKPFEDSGSDLDHRLPESQPQLPLAGEVDLESIRREYEAKQLWIDARELAARNGYDHQERENLTQELALEVTFPPNSTIKPGNGKAKICLESSPCWNFVE